MPKVPEDEMLLAKLIQNAASRGWKSTSHSSFRDSQGQGCGVLDAVACCAFGASTLEPGTRDRGSTNGIVAGNDSVSTDIYFTGNDSDFTVGQCFYDALS